MIYILYSHGTKSDEITASLNCVKFKHKHPPVHTYNAYMLKCEILGIQTIIPTEALVLNLC